jgi:hypothetical protein
MQPIDEKYNKSIIINRNLRDYTKGFLQASYQVEKLFNKHFICLGAFHPIEGISKHFDELLISIHIRPHLFLNMISFPNNLGNMIKYQGMYVVKEPCIVFAFLECVRRFLMKEKVYWKIINPADESFEIYV